MRTAPLLDMAKTKKPETRDAQLKRLSAAIKKTETQIKEILAKRGVGGMYLAETLDRLKKKRKPNSSKAARSLNEAAVQLREKRITKLKFDRDGHVIPSQSARIWVEVLHRDLCGREKLTLAQAKTLVDAYGP